MYFLYILKCNDNTLYTWITTDINRRIYEHNNTKIWSKYTFTRRPVYLVYKEVFENRSLATKREIYIKKIIKKWKNKFNKKFWNIKILYRI